MTVPHRVRPDRLDPAVRALSESAGPTCSRSEPQVLGFIDDCVTPLVEELGLPHRKDGMGNLICEIGKPDPKRSVILMAYAMTHPASSMTDPFAGELVETPNGPAVRGRGVSEQKGGAGRRAGRDCHDRLVRRRRRIARVLRLDRGRNRAPRRGDLDPRRARLYAQAGRGRHRHQRPCLARQQGPHRRRRDRRRARRRIRRCRGRGVNAIGWRPRGAETSSPRWRSTAVRIRASARRRWSPTPSKADRARPTPSRTRVRITLDRRLLPGQRPETAFAEIQNALSLPGAVDPRHPPGRLHVSLRHRRRRLADEGYPGRLLRARTCRRQRPSIATVPSTPATSPRARLRSRDVGPRRSGVLAFRRGADPGRRPGPRRDGVSRVHRRIDVVTWRAVQDSPLTISPIGVSRWVRTQSRISFSPGVWFRFALT